MAASLLAHTVLGAGIYWSFYEGRRPAIVANLDMTLSPLSAFGRAGGGEAVGEGDGGGGDGAFSSPSSAPPSSPVGSVGDDSGVAPTTVSSAIRRRTASRANADGLIPRAAAAASGAPGFPTLRTCRLRPVGSKE